MDTVINIENLYVRFGGNEALHNISCKIKRGDFIGLVGPNGAGKTTLAKAILGLVGIDSGKIIFLDKNNKQIKNNLLIGYLPQNNLTINPLFPAIVEEIVLLGLLSSKKIFKTINVEDRERMEKILSILQITSLKGKILSELSGGQQQKVLLARALVSNPDIIILDEPSTALDPNSRDDFFSLIKKINQETQTTIILITHDTGYIGNYANKLLYLDSKLIFFGEICDFCPSHDIHSCFEKKGNHLIWHQHN